MKRHHPAVKYIAAVLAVLLATGGFWATLFTLYHWDSLWLSRGNNFFQSSALDTPLMWAEYDLERLSYLHQSQIWNGSLTYSQEKELEGLEAQFTPENSNLRFQIHTQDGTLLYDNLEGQPLEGQVDQVRMRTMVFAKGNTMEEDYQIWDQEQAYNYVSVFADGERLLFGPEDWVQARTYGWIHREDGWSYDAERDIRRDEVEHVVEYGVNPSLPAHDTFWEARAEYGDVSPWLPGVAALALGLDLAALALLVFLCLVAARGPDGRIRLNWHDKIPLEIYAGLQFLAFLLIFGLGDSIAYSFHQQATVQNAAGLVLISLLAAVCTAAALLTLAARVKSHTLLHNTCLWRACTVLARLWDRIWHNWPLVWRVCVAFAAYLLGTVLTGLTVILIPVYQGLVLYLILRWVKQWQGIQAGTGRIVGGDPEFRIDTGRMYPDLKRHAQQLNDLGSAVGSAVEERLKSERFKAELITNVSHDLKTPLTSIINYVDLLKKEPVENPKALEYIEVLDRKSQRLKKLTEDLVEASKASTGSLTVNRERLGVVQLAQQALGEYEERFSQSRLEVVAALPQQELYVLADGRHLWRIIDNLLSNCCKYALEGTRVYLDILSWEGQVILSIKNISRMALNIPAEQLMERFVRGEASRTTEGSGLGLSIARSLTELQGGTFRLSIDGDLFKATVSFPGAPPQVQADALPLPVSQ